jgi:hypothetical protein
MRITTVLHRIGLRTIPSLLLALAAGYAGAQTPAPAPPAAAPTPPRPVVLLLQPGPFLPSDQREPVGGVIDVTLTIPDAQTAADTPLLHIPYVVNDVETVAVTLKELTVRDSHGNVPLATRDVQKGGAKVREWTSPREVNGDLVVHYQAPVDKAPVGKASARRAPPPPPPPPPHSLRTEGGGFTGGGSVFLLLPPGARPAPLALRWDLSKLGEGASATSDFGDGDVTLPVGSPERLWSVTFSAGPAR